MVVIIIYHITYAHMHARTHPRMYRSYLVLYLILTKKKRGLIRGFAVAPDETVYHSTDWNSAFSMAALTPNQPGISGVEKKNTQQEVKIIANMPYMWLALHICS